MKFTAVVSLLLATSAFAQTTPLGFTPATNKTLDVYYGTQYISPGIIVRKSSMSARCEGRNNYANANQSRKELLSSVSATRHLAGNTYLQWSVCCKITFAKVIIITPWRHRWFSERPYNNCLACPSAGLYSIWQQAERHVCPHYDSYNAFVILWSCASCWRASHSSLRILAAWAASKLRGTGCAQTSRQQPIRDRLAKVHSGCRAQSADCWKLSASEEWG
jgi:hypothetical protein